MSSFKELDPDFVWSLIQGQEDTLKPLLDKEEALFRHVACPQCGSYNHDVSINASRPFSPGAALPNKIMRCKDCSCEFDPYSRLIHRVPTL